MSYEYSPMYYVYVNGLEPGKLCSAGYGIVIQGTNQEDRALFAGKVAGLTGQGREYYALSQALNILGKEDRKESRVFCISSSQNVVNQMNRVYRAGKFEEQISKLRGLGEVFADVSYRYEGAANSGIVMARDLARAARNFRDGEWGRFYD